MLIPPLWSLDTSSARRQAIIDISTSMVFKTIWVIPRRRNEKKSLIVLFWRKPNPFEIFYIIYLEIFSCYSQIETKFKNSYTFDGFKFQNHLMICPQTSSLSVRRDFKIVWVCSNPKTCYYRVGLYDFNLINHWTQAHR